MSKHKQHAEFSEEKQCHREPHEPVVWCCHGKFQDMRLFLREVTQLRISESYTAIQIEKSQAEPEGQHERSDHLAAHVDVANVMNDEARVCEIDDKFIDTVVHLIVYKVYFSEEVSCEQDSKQNKILTKHSLTVIQVVGDIFRIGCHVDAEGLECCLVLIT